MLFILLALLVVVVLYMLIMDMKKPKNFPEGPLWWPLIGSALRVAKSRQETGMLIEGVAKIADEYSNERNVIGFKVGKDKVVFVFSTESLLEMFTNPDIDGRPYGPFYETRTWNLRRGILLTDEGLFKQSKRETQNYCQSHLSSDFWIVQRRFVQRHLKHFGYARKGKHYKIRQ